MWVLQSCLLLYCIQHDNSRAVWCVDRCAKCSVFRNMSHSQLHPVSSCGFYLAENQALDPCASAAFMGKGAGGSACRTINCVLNALFRGWERAAAVSFFQNT